MIDFLTAVWPVEIAPFVEIRILPPPGDMKSRPVSRFYDPNQVEDLLQMQSMMASYDQAGWDVYYGVLPRLERPEQEWQAGSASITADVSTVLWVDIDAKHMATFVDPLGQDPVAQKQEAFHRLQTIEQRPSILVDSAHGYHAYWLLDRTIEWRHAEAIMRALALQVGGDRVYDRPRILRVPGTHNHKDSPPTPVRVMRFDRDRVYRPGTFADYRDHGLELMAPRRADGTAFDAEPIATAREGADLPGWLLDKIAEKGEDRSEHSFSTVLWLLRYGHSQEDIFQVFIDNPEGVGNKFWEKGGPGHPRASSWLNHTIRSARDIA